MPTLEELDGEDWGEPTFPSGLVLRCHALRKKDIASFEREDFRVLLGQGFSTEYLAPLAIGLLQKEPVCEDELYDGALLYNLINPKNWDRIEPWKAQIKQIARRALDLLPPDSFSDEGRRYVDLPAAIANYLNH